MCDGRNNEIMVSCVAGFTTIDGCVVFGIDFCYENRFDGFLSLFMLLRIFLKLLYSSF